MTALCAVPAWNCGGGDTSETAVPSATAEALYAKLLSTRPPLAGGASLAELMSPAGGGRFDCATPELAAQPSAIDHPRLESMRNDGDGRVEVVIRYLNQPETVSQTATFLYVETSNDLTAVDAHARTFLDPSQPSADSC